MSGGRIERRAVLGAAMLAGIGGAVGCGRGTETFEQEQHGRPTAPNRRAHRPCRRRRATPTPSGSPTPADWKALAESLSGKLFRPGDAGYPVSHQLFDPAYDSVLPAAVAECANPTDVVTTLKFVERFKLPVVGKSGGHSYVGASTNHGGVVLSVTPIAGITFDGTTARVGAGAPLGRVYSGLARGTGSSRRGRARPSVSPG